MMTIDEILEWWRQDCRIDENDLDHESLKIPELHNKYLRPMFDARAELKRSILARKRLHGVLSAYYRGELNNPPDLARLGREPWPLKVKYANIEDYIDQDSEWIAMCDTVGYNEDRLAALDEVMGQLKNRGFQIKSALEFLKIKAGF